MEGDSCEAWFFEKNYIRRTSNKNALGGGKTFKQKKLRFKTGMWTTLLQSIMLIKKKRVARGRLVMRGGERNPGKKRSAGGKRSL